MAREKLRYKNQEDAPKLKLDVLLNENNIADKLEDHQLMLIADDAYRGFEADLASRDPWEKDLQVWTDMALQVSEKKSFPWPNAANIQFPLLATAAMQFAARSYPTLVPSNGEVVKCKVIGADPTGEKAKRAERVSKHMSYQVMEQMIDWEEDMDKLLIALPIAGTCFKKTYFDPTKGRNCSKLVLPKYLVVNYAARTLEDAERITEVLYLSKRVMQEKMNMGVYRDVELADPTGDQSLNTQRVKQAFQLEVADDDTTPYCVLEQHTYLDLDGDGYAEPYIVTLEENSKEILRIVARFDEDGVMINDKEQVSKIEPIQYYTKYSFIPNPDGGFYDIGFGRLLGPINGSCNTIINQLVDAGSLSNMQAGFIGKGLRIRMGETKFGPGEWKAVNSTGDDLKKQIFPLPVREPSQVLFNLLDLLLKSGKELASVAEIFVGKMPGQNTPATTTMATIEQGMKVFTAVYKRVYRALGIEFRKLYKLNAKYMSMEEYTSVMDEPAQQTDYKWPDDDIFPGADPNAVSSQEKQAKIQAVMQIMQLGTLDPMAVTQLYLEAHEIAQPEKYMKQPSPPPPDPKMEALKLKGQIDQQKAQTDFQLAQAKLQMEGAAEEQKMRMEAEAMQQKLKGKQVEDILKAHAAQADIAAGQQASQQKLQQSAVEHMQKLHQGAQSHQMQMATQAQAAKAKQQQAKTPQKGK